MLAQVQLCNILPRPLQTFVQLEQCASYQGSRRILSRRQHAPNKRYALNNNVHLITRFYSSTTCAVSKSWSHFFLLGCKGIEEQQQWHCECNNGELTTHACTIDVLFMLMQHLKHASLSRESVPTVVIIVDAWRQICKCDSDADKWQLQQLTF